MSEERVSEGHVEVPAERLSPPVLQRLLEEYVTRDGTDYGLVEATLAQKVDEVRAKLRRGEVVIVFDFASETCTLLQKDELARRRAVSPPRSGDA